MKFECDSCGANYMIADEKVGKRGVKVKCKRCSHVIIVRPANDGDMSAEAPPPSPDLSADQDVETKVGAAPSFSEPNAFSEQGAGGESDEREPSVDIAVGDEDDGDAWSTSADGSEPPPPPGMDDDDVPPPPLLGDGLGSDDQTAVGAVPGWKMSGEESDTLMGAGAGELPPPPAAGDLAAQDDEGDDEGDDELLGHSGEGDEQERAYASDAADSDADDEADDDADDGGDGGGDDDDVPAPPLGVSGAEMRGPEMAASDVGGVYGDEGLPPASMPQAEAGSDVLDEQLAGAFSNMFGDLPGGDPGDVPVPPPFGGDDLEQFRGPTQVLDLGRMESLRAQARPSDSSSEGGLRGEGTLDGIHPGLDANFSSLDASFDGRSMDTQQGDAIAPWRSNDATQMASGEEDEGGWHVAIDDEDIGPLELDQISEYIRRGSVDRDSLVWRSGMDDWEPAGDIPSIAAVFDAVPMPRIGPIDIGLPSARLGGGPPPGMDDDDEGGDPFSRVPDAADPSWQPHGLTDVYQAANLAEAAGLSAVRPALGRAPVDDNADEGEWRPGAAGALAALVQDEIARIDSAPEPAGLGGLAPADDMPGVGMLADGAGAGAEVGGIGAVPSSAALATGGLGAAPGLSSPHLSTPHLSTSHLSAAQLGVAGMPLNGGYSSPSLSTPMMPQVPMVDSYPPQPAMSGFVPVAQPPPKSPVVYIVGTVLVIFLVVIAAALVKLAFFGGQSTPVVAGAQDRGPDESGPTSTGGEAEGNPEGTRLASADVKPADAPPAGAEQPSGGAPPADPKGSDGAKDDDQVEAKDDKDEPPAKDDGKKAEANGSKSDDKDRGPSDTRKAKDDKRDTDKRDTDKRDTDKRDTKVASSKKEPSARESKAKDPPKRATKREKRRDPEPRKRERTASREKDRGSKSKKGCDPILDLDCDEKKPARKRKSDAKEKLEKSDILIVVKKEIGGVRSCFKKNGVDATIKMEWKILKSGRTSGVRVLTSKYAGTPVGRCLTDEIKRWRFPEYTGSAPPPITFPFKP